MAFVKTWRPKNGGGSGPTSNLLWKIDRFEVSAPFLSGTTFALTQTPIDADSIIAYFQRAPMDSDDYSYLSGSNEIEIFFSGDPAIINPDTGTVIFWFQYPYEV